MGAVAQRFSPGEAAVMALKAGADLLLNPADYRAAFEAVLKAVESGEISEAEINGHIGRIQSIYG